MSTMSVAPMSTMSFAPTQASNFTSQSSIQPQFINLGSLFGFGQNIGRDAACQMCKTLGGTTEDGRSLRAIRDDLESELDDVKGDIRGDIDDLKKELKKLRDDLVGDSGVTPTTQIQQLAQLRQEMRELNRPELAVQIADKSSEE